MSFDPLPLDCPSRYWQSTIGVPMPEITNGNYHYIFANGVRGSETRKFRILAWEGDALIKACAKEYLFSSVPHAPQDWLDRMTTCIENRYTQMMICVSLGLDEEVRDPLRGLYPAIDLNDPSYLKEYADVLEAYLGALIVSRRKEEAEKWTWKMVGDFFDDLKERIERQMVIWNMPPHADPTWVIPYIYWGNCGPVFEMRLSQEGEIEKVERYLLMPWCFDATDRRPGYQARWVPHADVL